MRYDKWMGGVSRGMIKGAKKKIVKQILECFKVHITPLTKKENSEDDYEMIIRYECIEELPKGLNLAMKIVIKKEEIAKWKEETILKKF